VFRHRGNTSSVVSVLMVFVVYGVDLGPTNTLGGWLVGRGKVIHPAGACGSCQVFCPPTEFRKREMPKRAV
jgi:hypothetical protein